MGSIAALIGDGTSLGFVEETEKQVVEHLKRHLKEMSPKDEKSREILQKMLEEEEMRCLQRLQNSRMVTQSVLQELETSLGVANPVTALLKSK